MARQYQLRRSPTAQTSQIDFASELNPRQCEAVTAPPGPALVIAGAGSGKTRTLTYRVAYLIENAIDPSNILLLTFTNKAAREMLERVAALIPHDLSGLWGGTFHSVGNRMLRRHAKVAGLQSGFSIMDREDQEDLLDAVVAQLDVGPANKRFPKGEVLGDIISFALNTGRTIPKVIEERYPHFSEFAAQIAAAREAYEVKKKAANVVDFDDLLEKTLRMLQNNADLAEFYQRQFQFVLVDEYQDTNHLQADFIDILSAKQRNVMVVGDDAQAIYSWRGANFQNILDFPKRYPEASVYKIDINYRSTPEILEVANAAIAANKQQFKKELISARKSGNKPACAALQTPNQQAQFVAQRILELNDEGISFSEIAVLYRAHFHSMEIQMELTRHGVPFHITSGLRFFEQAHIKDVAAFLKFASNPLDEVAFKRMARLLPGIGARSAEQLWADTAQALGSSIQAATATPEGGGGAVEKPVIRFDELLLPLKTPAKARKAWEQLAYTLAELAPNGVLAPPGEMIRSVVEAVYDDYARSEFPNYDQRMEDVNTLASFAREYNDVSEFLDQLALLTNLETERGAARDETEQVTLSSIHQAKGLEWKAVFVIWLSDGMFPNVRSLENESAIEEERRLFYVAVTRAKDDLYLTFPLLRPNSPQGEMTQRPSRFLREIPAELLEEWRVGGFGGYGGGYY